MNAPRKPPKVSDRYTMDDIKVIVETELPSNVKLKLIRVLLEETDNE